MLVFTTSYMFALIWIILCEIIEDFFQGRDFTNRIIIGDSDVFITNYHLNENTLPEATLIVIYFAFTSLTTVGFGDYYLRTIHFAG